MNFFCDVLASHTMKSFLIVVHGCSTGFRGGGGGGPLALGLGVVYLY